MNYIITTLKTQQRHDRLDMSTGRSCNGRRWVKRWEVNGTFPQRKPIYNSPMVRLSCLIHNGTWPAADAEVAVWRESHLCGASRITERGFLSGNNPPSQLKSIKSCFTRTPQSKTHLVPANSAAHAWSRLIQMSLGDWKSANPIVLKSDHLCWKSFRAEPQCLALIE